MVVLQMDADFEIINRKMIKVGNSYAVAIAPNKAKKFGFEPGVNVQVELRDGIVIITREGVTVTEKEKKLIQSELTKMDAVDDQSPELKADGVNLQGLNELSGELGKKSLAWVNQRVRGYNSNLRLGEKRRRVVIRDEQVVVLNLGLLTIASFPNSINGANFPALKGLRMTHCQLSDVDLSSVEKISSLERLILSNNELDEIDLSPLASLSNLKNLSLDSNLLDQISLDPLKNLNNIETICLSSNELEEIDLSPLIALDELKELYIDSNFLTNIDLSPLSKKKELILHLGSNKLESLDVGPLGAIPDLFLSLENNPLEEIDLEPLFGIANLQLEMPDKLTSGTMEQIKTLQEKGAELSKKPWKKITTGSIYTLPQDLHGITLAMLSLEEGEGTVEEIAKESSIPSNDALKKLTSLQKLGYIGKKHREGKTVYFRAS